ncbi:DUF4124 domain-containing protein [Gilvimarinus agarilyticus]|uniref:DUF4124 domain-containing protein n=1 Tax=Gilvimarinus agarilyticus TaxID=679259 RepID=UPI0005A152C4|nr:DUF4124 domain-containing protein [Gilvimarinus agarilyticus]
MYKIFGRTLGLLALVGAFGSTQVFADTFYKWTDEEGVVHFGTRPPSGKQSTAIQPKTGHSEPVNYDHFASDDEQAAARQQQTATQDKANKDPERCKVAQSNLEILNRGGRVREPTDDGSFIYLSEEQKAERIEQAQEAVDESC